jgi:anti-sigma regulatory factor (Ser/Thr protein kinase)
MSAMAATPTAGDAQCPEFVGERLELHFANDIAGLDARLQELRRFLEGHKVSARGLYRAELAFEELVVNVIRHAYRARETGRYPIDVSVAVHGGEILICVEDEGPPFDPSRVAEPPPPSGLENCRIGGLGLPLVRFATGQVHYERAAGRNRVTVKIPKD